ncbi:hypothetical protein MKX01_011527, partial [Papaver californicum]
MQRYCSPIFLIIQGCRIMPPRHITLPMRKVKAHINILDTNNRKNIVKVLPAKWDPTYS